MSESVTITIASSVSVEMHPEIDASTAAELQRRFPVGAAVGPTFLRLGRAAIPSVLDYFIGADVIDTRVTRPHDYADIEAKALPMPSKYSVPVWIAGPGGFVLLRPGCQRRAVPNLVRNMARTSGQRVCVVIPDPAVRARYAAGVSDLGFSDADRYSTVIDSLSSFDANNYGIVLVYDPDASYPATLNVLSGSRAECCFVVASPGKPARRVADMYACSVGPVLYSNERYAPVDLLPIAVPFSSPVYSRKGVVSMSDTLLAMLNDQRRNLALTDIVSRHRGHRTLLLSDRFSVASVISAPDIIAVPPENLSAACPGMRAAALKKINIVPSSARLTVLMTYDDAAASLPSDMRFDTAIYLTPASAKRQIAATFNLRRSAAYNVARSIYDCVDANVPELLAAARTRHAMHVDRAKATLYDMDKRFLI